MHFASIAQLNISNLDALSSASMRVVHTLVYGLVGDSLDRPSAKVSSSYPYLERREE